jgi:MFS family permease
MIINIVTNSFRMWGSKKKIICGVVFCQFITALSALGMPPFFSLMIEKSLSSGRSPFQTSLAGIFYVVPTLFAAISSPFWGMLADRFNKKTLLLRAQIGLAVSFLAAGFSTSVEQFFLALAIQGIFGGTFAASRAYIASLIQGEELTQSLTLMEAAPRAALVISPLLIGFLLDLHSPVEIYRYLAVLPILAAIFTLRIPEVESERKSESTPKEISNASSPIPFIELLMLQFLFGIASILPSPYFTHTMQARFSSLSSGQMGMLFGIPHLVYLAAATPLSAKIKSNRLYETLIGSFILQAVTLLGQSFSHSLTSVILWRVCMGLTMTASFISIHGLIAQVSRPNRAGGLFGWLESSVKVSSVIGGVIASFAYQYSGSNSHFSMSAGILSCTAILLTYRNGLASKERPA